MDNQNNRPLNSLHTYNWIEIPRQESDLVTKSGDRVTHDTCFRLYMDGVAIGDYYVSRLGGDCNVLFYPHHIMNTNAPIMGAMNADKARELLYYYGNTGNLPDIFPARELSMHAGSSIFGMPLYGGQSFDFKGTLPETPEETGDTE